MSSNNLTTPTHKENPFEVLEQTEEIQANEAFSALAHRNEAVNDRAEGIVRESAESEQAAASDAQPQDNKLVESSWGTISEAEASQNKSSDAQQEVQEHSQGSDANKATKSLTSSQVEPTVGRGEVLSPEERYTKAIELKENAKSLIQQKSYEEAIAIYTNALTIINPNLFTVAVDGDLKKKLSELRIMLLNNISQCKLSLDKVDDALWYAERVVLQEPDNIKALFRIAMCYEKQAKHSDAFEKLKEILQIHKRKDLGVTVDIRDAYDRVKQRIQGDLDVQKKKEKELYQKMVTGKEIKDESVTTSTSHARLVKKGLLLLPSAAIAYLIVKKGLNGNIHTSKAQGTTAFLSLVLFGSLFTEKLWLRGVLASSAALFTGLAYKNRFL